MLLAKAVSSEQIQMKPNLLYQGYKGEISIK